MEKETSQRIERYKATLDYAKHLTTLSSGAIVIVASFIEKVFPAGHWKPLLAFSLVCFLICILGAVMLHTVWLGRMPERVGKFEHSDMVVAGFSVFAAWLGFLGGMISLCIFAVRNLA